MRIIHYTLGVYPERTGGLNRYATDLMIEQAKEHEVAALIPGGWCPWSKKCYIKKTGKKGKLTYYRLMNTLPLPLLHGIKNPKFFIERNIQRNNFEGFYNSFKPEVLHLHSLMGISEQTLAFFKEKGVKIVYTTHDYFGICPKVNLIDKNGMVCTGPEDHKCEECNNHAPSTLFLRFVNSSVFFLTRNFVRWMKDIISY